MYAHCQLLALPEVYLYTFIHNTQSKSLQDKYRKKCVTFLRGGSPKERPYDVSRGQYQYVTLPLVYEVKFGLHSGS